MVHIALDHLPPRRGGGVGSNPKGGTMCRFNVCSHPCSSRFFKQTFPKSCSIQIMVEKEPLFGTADSPTLQVNICCSVCSTREE